MKDKYQVLTKRYRAALIAHLISGTGTELDLAADLGADAVAAGIQTLQLAKLHEQTLISDILPNTPSSKHRKIIKQAGVFFAATITPLENTHRNSQEVSHRLKVAVETLSQRTVELATSNLQLSQEVAQRKAVGLELKKSERHYAQLLEQSGRLQEQLRQLSRKILSTQEDERKKISRELHDVIAQTLTSINIRLSNLKKGAALTSKGLDRSIERTQRLVEKSVEIVHQFARQLRPAVLDDLGLISALHSHLKNFTIETGILTRLTTAEGMEQLDPLQRTVLYRVAQEALTNVARHSKASHAEVVIERLPNRISMKIKDDGQSFNVEKALHANVGRRLGLMGMRERLEMVGGHFVVESKSGIGTTVTAEIPTKKIRPSQKATSPKHRADKKV